jgi:hypothetical protein
LLQARTAPVQRLADKVAGKFTYGVMAAAAVTFVFWAGIGTKVFPQVGHPKSLAPSTLAHPVPGAFLFLSSRPLVVRSYLFSGFLAGLAGMLQGAAQPPLHPTHTAHAVLCTQANSPVAPGSCLLPRTSALNPLKLSAVLRLG